jgi:hypothetical protein
MGRVEALSKEDDSKLSPEEKAAIEAMKAKALEEIPKLVKSLKQLDTATPAGKDSQPDDWSDHMACVLYGALNLDEQQFRQVYSLVQNFDQEAKQRGLSLTNSSPASVATMKQMIDQFKTETQPLLTSEQSRILAEVLTHLKLSMESRNFNFSFSL